MGRRPRPVIPFVLLVLFGPGAAMADGNPPPYAAAFSKAFEAGWSVNFDSPGEPPRLTTIRFTIEQLGKLNIVSGRICAADPFVGILAKPFAQPVPNGAFRVRLAVLSGTPAELGNGRIAFARVDFSSAPVARWSIAHGEGADPASLKPDEIFGYGVDSGTGSFFDPEASEINDELSRSDELSQSWIAEGEANGKAASGGFGFRLIKPVGRANIAMFNSGWGDGFYASWFGFDATGNVVALVTDFRTIDWSKVQF